MQINYIAAVLFVKDIHAARRFYEEVLGQTVNMDLGLNIEFAGGFALWQHAHATQTIYGQSAAALPAHSQHTELYF